MESPVRINTGLYFLLIASLCIESYYTLPNYNVDSKHTTNSPIKESTTVSSRDKYNSSSLFQPRTKSWLFQRRNVTVYPTSQTETNTTDNSGEVTVNYGNKINFRGSVKYFATRPPFKPKSVYLKRNNTSIKSDSSERLDLSRSPSLDKVKILKNSHLTSLKSYQKKNDTEHDVTSTEASDSESNNNKIETTTENLKDLKTNERSDGGKSLNLEFNIDKYTSPEFHDINNVYSQSVSPEVEHFIVPENVSEYFISVGSAPAYRQNSYYQVNRVLTTPQTDLFDRRFKEVSDSIKQNLADAEYFSEEKFITESSFSEDATDKVNFEELLSKGNDTNAKLVFKNTKEVSLTDSENSMSKHSDYTDLNDTKIFYEKSVISTETYDQSSTTITIINKDDPLEVTSPSPLSNNIDTSDKINATKRSDHFKTNETRLKEYLTTIRNRPRTTTTPRPKPKISLKSTTEIIKEVAVNETTTKYPSLPKASPYTRRKNIGYNGTYSTMASKLDPVYQADTSPTRVSEYVRQNSQNAILLLRKRGSVKYDTNNSTTTISSKNDDSSLPFNIPPTATAWALASLRHTPVNRKDNSSHERAPQKDSNALKTDDDLQKSETTTANLFNVNTIKATLNKTNNKITDNDVHIHEEMASASKLNYASVTLPDVIDSKSEKSSTTEEYLEATTSTDPSTSTDDDESETSTPNPSTLLDEESDYTTDEDYDIQTTTVNNLRRNSTKMTIVYPINMMQSDTTYSSDDTTIAMEIDETTTTQEPAKTRFNFEDFETNAEYDYDSSTTNEPTTTEFVNIKPTNFTETTTREASENMLLTTVSYNKTDDYTTTLTSPAETTNAIVDKYNRSNSRENTDTFTNVYEEITSTQSAVTEDSNSVYSFTTNAKNSKDIEAASTVYYGSTPKIELTSPTTIISKQSTISERSNTPDVTTTRKSAIVTSLNSEENFDSREAKKTNDEDKPSASNNINNNDNMDDWIDSADPTGDIKQLDSNEIPTNPSVKNNTTYESTIDQDNVEEPNIDYNAGGRTRLSMEKTTVTSFVPSFEESNIEVIEPNRPHAVSDRPRETTTVDEGEIEEIEGSNAIAAITISVIGVVALLLLVIVLIVARGRRRSGGYGQRCTPVSLDSYSLDNVSISGSTRRKARRPSKRSYGNPAYDESGATSHPMQFAALANFALDQDSIVSEFNEIPTISARADEVPPGCESKNRYSNVIPLPETRVMLKPISGDETSEYINANYVRGPKNMKNYYIACQAPMSSTSNDFWRMVWEQNSRVILMLTEFMENGVEKCFEYIPPSEVSDNRRVFGDYQIIVKKREVRDKYVISVLQVKSMSLRIWREVTHMWYFWPTKGVPDECHSIIAFLIEARSYLKASQSAKEFDEEGHDSMVTQNNQKSPSVEKDDNSNGGDGGDVNIYNVQNGEQQNIKNGTTNGGFVANNNDNSDNKKKCGPMIVHCSPGTGRTGALIACDIGIRDYEISRTVDIPKTVYRIRRDRANAVQTKDQYIFIYKVLSEYATKLTGGILDSI